MKVSKKIYIDKDVSNHRWKIWKLSRCKKIDNIYCIVYREGKFLEIVKSSRIKGDYDKSLLIGIAATKQNALELLARIFDEVYVPNPNLKHMKEYFNINK